MEDLARTRGDVRPHAPVVARGGEQRVLHAAEVDAESAEFAPLDLHSRRVDQDCLPLRDLRFGRTARRRRARRAGGSRKRRKGFGRNDQLPPVVQHRPDGTLPDSRLRELRATAQVRHQRLSCRRWILALRARDLVAHTLERGNSLLGAQLGRRVRLRRGASLQKQKNADGRDRTTHGPPRESKGAKRPSASSRSQTMIPKRRRTLKDLPRCGQTAN